jgi:hypothetical protein
MVASIGMIRMRPARRLRCRWWSEMTYIIVITNLAIYLGVTNHMTLEHQLNSLLHSLDEHDSSHAAASYNFSVSMIVSRFNNFCAILTVPRSGRFTIQLIQAPQAHAWAILGIHTRGESCVRERRVIRSVVSCFSEIFSLRKVVLGSYSRFHGQYFGDLKLILQDHRPPQSPMLLGIASTSLVDPE